MATQQAPKVVHTAIAATCPQCRQPKHAFVFLSEGGAACNECAADAAISRALGKEKQTCVYF